MVLKSIYQKEWQYNHPEQWKIIHDKASRKYEKTHRKIKNAENLAQNHILLGKICEFGGCNSTEKLNRCHLDYDKPLEVITLCCKHHKLVDILYKEID